MMIQDDDYLLRSANRGDLGFLRNLHGATMKDYVAETWGWHDAVQAELFEKRFDALEWQVITVNGDDVGALSVEDAGTEIFVNNIQILPQYQGRGIGTGVINDILARARERGVPVSLQVLKVNERARGLYRRLGFTVVGESQTHVVMTQPSPEDPTEGRAVMSLRAAVKMFRTRCFVDRNGVRLDAAFMVRAMAEWSPDRADLAGFNPELLVCSGAPRAHLASRLERASSFERACL